MKRAYRQREGDLTKGLHKVQEIKAFEKLMTLDRTHKEEKYLNVPSRYIPKSKFEDRTANGLSKMIITWFTLNNHKAWRQSSEGRFRPGQQVVDVIGRTRIMKGQFYHGQNNGQSDVAAIVDGRFCAVEIKIGNDKQSDAQKKYQKEVTDSGGLYVIARSFGQFMQWYESEIEMI